MNLTLQILGLKDAVMLISDTLKFSKKYAKSICLYKLIRHQMANMIG